MLDLTETVIATTFSAALGIFIIAASIRKFLGHHEQKHDTTLEVPTWFYNRLDLLGLSFIFLLFSGLVISSLMVSEKAARVIVAGDLLGQISLQFIIASIVSAFVLSRVKLTDWLGLKWKSWWLVFFIAPAAVLFMWLLLWALYFLNYMKWIQSLGVDVIQDSVKLLQEAKDPAVLGLMALAAVIVAPICEEIVFRGYFYPAAKKFIGTWSAGICSALVFSAAHGSVAALLPIFLLGGLLVFLYEKTGSIWAPIAVHLCFNGATVGIQIAARFYDIPINPAL